MWPNGTRTASRLRKDYLFGLSLGVVFGLCYSTGAGVLLWAGLVLVALLVANGPWAARLGGALTGFGAVLFALVAQIAVVCATNASCVQPNETSWLVIVAAILAPGLVLSAVALRPRAQ